MYNLCSKPGVKISKAVLIVKGPKNSTYAKTVKVNSPKISKGGKKIARDVFTVLNAFCISQLAKKNRYCLAKKRRH